MTENQIHPNDITAYIQDNGLPQNNIDLADMVNFFAELIVEECIFAIDEQCSNSDAEGTIEAITILQKHFRS